MSNKPISFLKRKREEKRLTLKDVGEKSGVSWPYIHKIEQRDSDSTPYPTLLKIAQALDIDINVMMVNFGRLPNEFFIFRKDRPEELTEELLKTLKRFEKKYYETGED